VTKKYSKLNFSHNLGLKIIESSIKSYSLTEGFPRTHPNLYLYLYFLILSNFLWQNYSICNNSYTIGLNSMKPPWCTPVHQVFSNNTKIVVGGVMISKISTWVTKKTNYLNFNYDFFLRNWYEGDFLEFIVLSSLDNSKDNSYCMVILRHFKSQFQR
jgi:hypothetical protein